MAGRALSGVVRLCVHLCFFSSVVRAIGRPCGEENLEIFLLARTHRINRQFIRCATEDIRGVHLVMNLGVGRCTCAVVQEMQRRARSDGVCGNRRGLRGNRSPEPFLPHAPAPRTKAPPVHVSSPPRWPIWISHKALKRPNMAGNSCHMRTAQLLANGD